MSSLLEATAGASEAPCAVCGDSTLLRVMVGDGVAPVCSTFCEHAWPNVRRLIAENERLREELTAIADIHCESDAGFRAERALMTEEQRAAVDAARASESNGTEAKDGR